MPILVLRALRAAYFLACLTLLVPPGSIEPARAQESREPPSRRPIPTFESLPHVALPTSGFSGWCGQHDRYLLDEDGALKAYEAGTKVADVAISAGNSWRCRSDGQQLIYISDGHAMKVDIASGDSQWLASFKNGSRGQMAFSPDFESVATSDPLELKPPAAQIRIILVGAKKNGNKTERPEWITWSEDGSKIAVVYATSVDMLDINGVKIASMTKPDDGWVRTGWFEKDQRALTLFMETEMPPGSVLKCSTAERQCRVRPRVDSISVGGRGRVGIVIPLGKPPVRTNDAIIFSHEYAAEIRDSNSKLLVRQVFPIKTGRNSFGIAVSPSGNWSILTWDDESQPGCVYGRSVAGVYKCRQGMLVDLTKVNK